LKVSIERLVHLLATTAITSADDNAPSIEQLEREKAKVDEELRQIETQLGSQVRSIPSLTSKSQFLKYSQLLKY
jgi:hypothetical protein